MMIPSSPEAVDGKSEFGLRWTPLVEDLSREHDFEPLEVEGSLPTDLAGTLLRVGPGLFSRFGRRYGHLFDADGAVSAVRFSGGKAFGAARVIESAELLHERKAGKPLYFGFGTQPPGIPRSLKAKNAANTNLLAWNDRLFALYEPSLPTELGCNGGLSTKGQTDLGVVNDAFSAHPHYSPSRKAVYNFGLRVLPWGSYLDLYELSDAGSIRPLTTLSVPGAVFVHDFIVTDRHAIFFICPIRLRWGDVLRRKTIAQSLAWKPELGTTVLVVPLDAPYAPTRLETESLMLFHFANAFERGRQIVLDFVRYPDFDLANRLTTELLERSVSIDAKSRLCRAVLDLDNRRVSFEERWSRTCEFPIVAPRTLTASHRYVYLVAMSPDPGASRSVPTRVAKADLATGKVSETSFGSECYPSEALFVPRPQATSEDDGYLLSLVFDGKRGASFIAVLDAKDIEKGTIARAWFDHAIPITFHGLWQGRSADLPSI